MCKVRIEVTAMPIYKTNKKRDGLHKSEAAKDFRQRLKVYFAAKTSVDIRSSVVRHKTT